MCDDAAIFNHPVSIKLLSQICLCVAVSTTAHQVLGRSELQLRYTSQCSVCTVYRANCYTVGQVFTATVLLYSLFTLRSGGT